MERTEYKLIRPKNVQKTFYKAQVVKTRKTGRNDWPGWVIAISNSLAAGEWLAGAHLEPWVKEAYESISDSVKKQVSYSDEITKL